MFRRCTTPLLLHAARAPAAGARTHAAKPLRLVVRFPPGGGNDIRGRIVAQIDSTVASALAHAQSGRLHAVAVTTAKRFGMTPEVPTMPEAGMPGFGYGTWYVVLEGRPRALRVRGVTPPGGESPDSGACPHRRAHDAPPSHGSPCRVNRLARRPPGEGLGVRERTPRRRAVAQAAG